MDNGPAVTTQSVEIPRIRSANSGLYIGGMPQLPVGTGGRYTAGIRGCVADLVLNTDYHLQLVSSSTLGRNVGECGV